VTSIEARSGADDPGGGLGIESDRGATRSVKLEMAVLLVGILLVLLMVTATIGGAPPG
jgi:hypothetical protein